MARYAGIEFTFQITNPTGGFGGWACAWSERSAGGRGCRMCSAARADTASRVSCCLCPGSDFPVEIVLASTAPTEQILSVAQELRKRAVSGKFAFPPIIDVNAPQTEIAGSDKIADMGLNLQQIGQDLGGHWW